MKVYHATTENAWKKIQKEGVLWGKRSWAKSRLTYLALKRENAVYGKGDGSGEWSEPEVLLEVEIPAGNYPGDDWQIRYYKPIPIKKVTRVI